MKALSGDQLTNPLAQIGVMPIVVTEVCHHHHHHHHHHLAVDAMDNRAAGGDPPASSRAHKRWARRRASAYRSWRAPT